MSKSFSLNDEIICIKVENAYTVWFKATRSFLLIEEPAFYILKLFLKNIPKNEIADKFSIRYNIPLAKVEKFILELEQDLHKYLVQTEKEPIHEEQIDNNELNDKGFYAEKMYAIGNLYLKINYGDFELEKVIHPLISHHEIEKPRNQFHMFELYRIRKKLILKVDGNIIEMLQITDTGYLKAAVLLQILNILHGISSENWMMTVHAAAVTDGNTAVIFPARAGSGKSTLASLLHAYGFNMLSDDFLAMDLINKRVYPLPVAATIKEGSFNALIPHFPELKDILPEKAYTGKHVRYLPIKNLIKTENGFLAKNFVFISYSAHSSCLFEEVPKKIAMQLLLQETWVNPISHNIAEFFNWFDKTKFFELKYSRTEDVIKVVTKLFK